MAKRKHFRAPGFKPLPSPIAQAFRLNPIRPTSVAPRKGPGSYRRRPARHQGKED